jgi:hypothetical protein
VRGSASANGRFAQLRPALRRAGALVGARAELRHGWGLACARATLMGAGAVWEPAGADGYWAAATG